LSLGTRLAQCLLARNEHFGDNLVEKRNGLIEAINLMRRVRQDGAGISQPRRAP
jgi:hypothetical protein